MCVCLAGPTVYLTHFVVTLSVGLEKQLAKISAAAARLLAELILLVSRSCCRLFFVFPSFPVCLFTSLKFKEETCKVFFLINLYYFKIVLSSISRTLEFLSHVGHHQFTNFSRMILELFDLPPAPSPSAFAFSVVVFVI